MPPTLEASVLPHLIAAFHRLWRSLPRYLQEACPWSGRNSQEVRTALDAIAAAQLRAAERIAGLITARGAALPTAPYPDAFVRASLHYVGVDYLLREAVRAQQTLVGELTSDHAACTGDASAAEMLGDIINQEREHLATLERLAREPHSLPQLSGA